MMASPISFSGSCSAKPSIIRIDLLEPATIRSSVLSAICWTVGITISSLSIIPIRTAAMGPLNGMPEIRNAALPPVMLSTSGLFSPSQDITLDMTWTSSRYPFGNSGRSGRSVRRHVRISLVVGRPSRFRYPPANLPADARRSR